MLLNRTNPTKYSIEPKIDIFDLVTGFLEFLVDLYASIDDSDNVTETNSSHDELKIQETKRLNEQCIISQTTGLLFLSLLGKLHDLTNRVILYASFRSAPPECSTASRRCSGLICLTLFIETSAVSAVLGLLFGRVHPSG